MVRVVVIPHPFQASETGRVRVTGVVVRRVTHKVHGAALPERRRQHRLDGAFQALVAVGDDILDAGQTTLFQPLQKRLPAGFAFLIRRFHREDVTLPVRSNTDRELYRPYAELPVAEWTEETLIPKAVWDPSTLNDQPTAMSVVNLANELEIHPALVAGQVTYKHRNYRLLSQFVGTGEIRRLFI